MSEKTPMERLERWRVSLDGRDVVMETDRRNPQQGRWTVELWWRHIERAKASAPTLDAAILAALEQANGGTE